MPDSFLLPIDYQCDKYEEMHFMQDGAPSHLALPVPGWLNNYLPATWIDVENQQNGLREVSIAIHIISFREFEPKMSTDEKQEQLKNWNSKFKTLCRCSSALQEKC
jgi:hypothetical protein